MVGRGRRHPVIDYARLSGLIREAVEEHGLSPWALAHLAGLSYPAVKSLLEGGDRDRLEVDTLLRVSWALGLDPCELINGALNDIGTALKVGLNAAARARRELVPGTEA